MVFVNRLDWVDFPGVFTDSICLTLLACVCKIGVVPSTKKKVYAFARLCTFGPVNVAVSKFIFMLQKGASLLHSFNKFMVGHLLCDLIWPFAVALLCRCMHMFIIVHMPRRLSDRVGLTSCQLKAPS